MIQEEEYKRKRGILVIETALPTKAHPPILSMTSHTAQTRRDGTVRETKTPAAVQIQKYTNTQILKYTNAQIQI